MDFICQCFSENRSIEVEMKTFDLVFPFQYDVDGMKEQAVNTIKWLKLIHDIKPKPFTSESKLPPDVFVKFTEYFRIQLTCDPFEVKLLNNYDLLRYMMAGVFDAQISFRSLIIGSHYEMLNFIDAM